MDKLKKQEFESILNLLIPDNSPKVTHYSPGDYISPEDKTKLIDFLLYLWDLSEKKTAKKGKKK